jgi:hypothetical protein
VRSVVALVVCAACVETSVDTDGTWAPLDTPCVSVGPVHKLLDTHYSVVTALAGGTLLYSGGGTVSQLDLATGKTKLVLRSDGISEFATFGNDIVYYESDGDPVLRRPIDVIIDHGAHSTSRYQRISPRPGQYSAGLITTSAGIYWWTASDDFDAPKEEWRWNPDTGVVEPFVMDATTIVRSDATHFFYFDSSNRLIVRPQLPGPPDIVVQFDEKLPPPMPIAIDGDEVFYVPYQNTDLDGDLIARSSDGTERVLVTGQRITNGALDANYVYFTQDCGAMNGGPFDARCENLYRVPRAGGPIQTVFDGENNSTVFGVETDGCNVYWQQFRIDGGSLYAGEITP